MRTVNSFLYILVFILFFLFAGFVGLRYILVSYIEERIYSYNGSRGYYKFENDDELRLRPSFRPRKSHFRIGFPLRTCIFQNPYTIRMGSDYSNPEIKTVIFNSLICKMPDGKVIDLLKKRISVRTYTDMNEYF
jgi:hypothetical protein